MAHKHQVKGTHKSLDQRGLVRLAAGFVEKSGLWRLRGSAGAADYFRFLARHPQRLGFCLLWTCFSGLGQTYFLSLFQPYWVEHLGLSTGAMGALYGSATLLSACALGKAGQWVDRVSEQRVTLVATAGLAIGWCLGALSTHWLTLFLSIALLRFFGQGLSAMLATTSAARWFPEDQSKAVSVSGLGYPLGEAVLPFVVVSSIVAFGWRGTAGGAALAVLVAGPLSLWLLGNRIPKKMGKAAPSRSKESNAIHDKKNSLYRQARFYQLLLVTAPLPFFATGIIFFQASLGQELGWEAQNFAAGFLCFAIVRASFALGVGALADKIGPLRLFGSPLLFFALGLFALALFGGAAIYPFFVCIGLAFGISGAITTPILGTIFGMDKLGAARGASASITVFATAASPAIFGWALGSGISARLLLLVAACSILIGFWPFSIRLRRICRSQTQPVL